MDYNQGANEQARMFVARQLWHRPSTLRKINNVNNLAVKMTLGALWCQTVTLTCFKCFLF